jgi:FAD/FMN-containing dehydrogenase
MKRRSFLKRLAEIPVLGFLWRHLLGPTEGAGGAANHSFRRVRPSDPSWPTAASWEKLKQDVGGHLIKVESPFGPCESSLESASCQEILKNLQNPYYIGDQAGATQSTGWVDAWISAPSVYGVAARSTDDVVAAVNFARENNLRVVVKGGGHSYQGTSNAADSLLIWTRAMNDIVLHDAFVGRGCEGSQAPQPAVTIGAGAMWIDAYNAVTTAAGRYVQGGGCATVGVAGLIQSGGFGSFSKNYGMAAAGLLEAEVVTADGAVRTVNACNDSDLFWGLKGGGGGSLGVVTKVTLRTTELPAFFGIVGATITAVSDAVFRQLIKQFVGFYAESLFNPHWGETVIFRPDNSLAIAMLFQGLDLKQAEEVWKPFIAWVSRSPAELLLTLVPGIVSFPARKMWDVEFLKKNAPGMVFTDYRPGAPESHLWWASNQGEVGIFWHGYESLWLPASLLEKEQQKQLADALFAGSRHWRVSLHFNKGLAGAPADAVAASRDTAMNPLVLDAFALAIIAGGRPRAYPGVPGHEPDLTSARQQAAAIAKSMDELRKIVPEVGSYVSETNFFEQSWQRSFWGTNYPRLQAVKAKYDPTGLFFVHHGVGSEDWSPDGFTRLT